MFTVMHLIGVAIAIPFVVVTILRLYLSSGARCKIKTRLEGKVIIITGANTGIGKATAIECIKRGAKVILACRNKTKGEATATLLRKMLRSDNVNYLPLDLASFHSIREFVALFTRQFKGLYALVNNAAYMGPKARTEDDIDLCFQVNYLGHFLLTELLLSKIKPNKQNPLRIINLTSDSYQISQVDFDDIMIDKGNYDIYQAYGRTKLAMVWFSNELSFRYASNSVTSVSVHPGATKTKLMRNWPGIKGEVLRQVASLFFRSSEIGAQSVIQCLVVDYLEDYVNKVVIDCRPCDLDASGKDYRCAEKLWKESLVLSGLEPASDRKEQNGIRE